MKLFTSAILYLANNAFNWIITLSNSSLKSRNTFGNKPCPLLSVSAKALATIYVLGLGK